MYDAANLLLFVCIGRATIQCRTGWEGGRCGAPVESGFNPNYNDSVRWNKIYSTHTLITYEGSRSRPILPSPCSWGQNPDLTAAPHRPPSHPVRHCIVALPIHTQEEVKGGLMTNTYIYTYRLYVGSG